MKEEHIVELAKGHLVKGEIQAAIDVLREHANEAYQKKLDLLASRYKRIRDQKTEGVLTLDQENAARNQLTSDFLHILQNFNVPEQSTGEKFAFVQQWQKFLLGGFIMILILAGAYAVSFWNTSNAAETLMETEQLMASMRILKDPLVDYERKEELKQEIQHQFDVYTRVVILGKNGTVMGEEELAFFLEELSQGGYERFQIEKIEKEQIIIKLL